MTTRLNPTICGLWCDDCTHFEEECPGCSETGGCTFWTEFVDIDACPVYSCCVEEKGLAHCGFCDKMPCDLYTRFRDPEMTEEDQIKSLENQRQELIRRRKESD
ncbi:MAG TPA: DUF3795 domain-containing protein [Methanospirillum sp.]|nr:DUF3795 domain-containing protein [Methanospirillum sp.]